MKNKKISVLLLTLVLFIVTFIIMIFKGKTYVLEVYYPKESMDDIELSIEQNKEVIEIIDTEIKDNVLKLKIKSINEGEAYINISIKNKVFSKYFIGNRY